ncbi:hypothetical protein M3Y99_00310800 [Aphelenchoides fujianensis]|nr:hypothetical protein M3Y99_00310800 [Aphelenchoides fujianensis]
MSSDTLSSFLMVYCFPVQFIIGVTGNTVNLIVLLNKRMRSKTNVLLATMALADILFLVSTMPHTLYYYTNLIGIKDFRRIYVYLSHHLIGITNMFSFISAWVIVLVSVERMTAVLFPLRARILIASILVSMHSHITHSVNEITYNKTVSNATMNWTMEKMPAALDNTAHRCSSETQTDGPTHQSAAYPKPQSRNQRRASFVVFLIASTFTICNFPSALTHICLIVWPEIDETDAGFITVITLANSLVVTSKTLNLFLFCMWSDHFRKNLFRIFHSKLETLSVWPIRKSGWKSEAENIWKGRGQLRRSYNQPKLVPTTSKRSLPTLKRNFQGHLQTRHSLPANVDPQKNGIEQAESEREGLITWHF